MQKYTSHLLLLLFQFIFCSCSFFENNDSPKEETPLIQVFDNYLYSSDIKEVVGENMNAQDSSTKAQNFIDAWIRDKLLVQRAEQNLTMNEKNVKWQLEDYRSKLLIYKYEQKYIDQKLDTTITNKEIEEYYSGNAHNFKLSSNVLKALVVKFNNDAPKLYKTKWWFRSNRQRDSLLFVDYAKKNALEYDSFDNQWIYFADLLAEIPLDVQNQEDFIKKNEFYEMKDSEHTYYLRIKKYRLINEISPLYFVKNNVKTIILNEKKQNLIHKLERSICDDGIEKGFVKLNKKNAKNIKILKR